MLSDARHYIIVSYCYCEQVSIFRFLFEIRFCFVLKFSCVASLNRIHSSIDLHIPLPNEMEKEKRTIRLQSGDFSYTFPSSINGASIAESSFIYFLHISSNGSIRGVISVDFAQNQCVLLENVSKFVQLNCQYECHSKDSEAIDGKETKSAYQRFTGRIKRHFIEEYGGSDVRPTANKIGES